MKFNVVRVKGLEPPRQRRQNLNSANTTEYQSLALDISQNIAETKRESAKPGFNNKANENPGATAIATGAKDDVEGVLFPAHDSPKWHGAPAIILRHFCGVLA